MDPGKPAYLDTVRHFGREILKSDGTLDRDNLGSVIFGNTDSRKALNAFTHPRVIREMMRQTFLALLLGKRMCVWDVPLLIEGGMARWLPIVAVVFWCVLCCRFRSHEISRLTRFRSTPDQQLKRLLARNPELSEEAAKQRIASQMPVEEKRKRATHVIDNSDTKDSTKRQVDDLMRAVMPGRLRTVFWWSLMAVPSLIGYGCLTAYDAFDALIARSKSSR
jgi:dephospho-CoA kinase